MSSRAKLLPVLHDAEWSGREVAACRPLVPGEHADWMPLVAYAYDHPDRRETVTVTGLEEQNRTLDELAAEATRNVIALAVPVQPRGDGSVVAVHEHASALLTSPSDLGRICAQLGAQELLLTAPTAGLLVGIARPPSGDGGLERFAIETFARSLDTRTSPLVFTWDGRRLGVHREAVPVERRGAWVERAYDADEELLTLRLEGALGPATRRVVEKLLAHGQHDDGRPVAALRLVVPTQDTFAELRARFSPDDVELQLEPGDGG